MTITVLRETFVQSHITQIETPKGSFWTTEHGTVDVIIGGQRKTIEASRVGPDAYFGWTERSISLPGFVGRYRTSAKKWRASVISRPSSLFVDFGRDDRCGRFNKLNFITYDPEGYKTAA